MVYAGTETVTVEKLPNGLNRLKISTAGIDANAEEGSVIDLHKYQINLTKAGIIARRTAGSTDTVEVNIMASADGTEYEELASCVSSAASTAFVWASSFATKSLRYVKVVCVTVGSGNTLTSTVYLE